MAKFTVPHSRGAVLSGELFDHPWSRFFQDVARRIGSNKSYSLGGRLATDTTAVGNVGTGVDDLITYSLEKNILLNVGDSLEIVAFGTFANNSNDKELTLVFGTTEIFTTTVKKPQNTGWRINATIIRTGAASQLISATYHGEALANAINAITTSATEDFSTALTIKCTGEATSNNDIIQKGLLVKLFPTN